ncbi:hypothetical protein NDU88_009490 [Pleurodeles waltl]|uniref:Uncharacterized protein n=1 Tax=Pleurodeles waltl TaxID=8319 RepID=A0AAV7QVY7_PLEWA|nr:hypothetical protein NDU88_009490 [Pleurodeles waltl]
MTTRGARWNVSSDPLVRRHKNVPPGERAQESEEEPEQPRTCSTFPTGAQGPGLRTFPQRPAEAPVISTFHIEAPECLERLECRTRAQHGRQHKQCK